MELWASFRGMVASNPLAKWLVLMVVAGLLVTVFRGFFLARKIQPNGFSWKTLRNEVFFAVLNLSISTFVLGVWSGFLHKQGLISFNTAPASWWVIALEYAGFFFAYDAYFYWMHRAVHHRRIYPWVHKLHHLSTSPNVLTTVSLNPVDTVLNGISLPVFTALFTFHTATMAFIGPTNILMGLYVHSGYEFLPRWWNKTWITRWFITTTFHDQHHKYFNYNFGAFTTIWDRICGTDRPKYLADFDEITARRDRSSAVPEVAMANAGAEA